MISPTDLAQLLRLAGEGMRLFPLRPGTKIPYAGFSWPKLATTDPATIRQWSQAYPDCNWALATGPESGVFVIDVDPEGLAYLKQLVREHGGEWGHTRTVKTPRGFHLYFRWDPAHPVGTATAVHPGIDLRGANGYVTIPPSRISEVD